MPTKKPKSERLQKFKEMFDPSTEIGARYLESKKRRAEEGEKDFRRRQHIKESMERRRSGNR